METVTLGVLGPVEVRAAGRPAIALPPSVRALLARLVMSPGRVVSVDALTDALWGEDLPAEAANALQIRVSKLRRALVAAGVPQGVLVTRAPGLPPRRRAGGGRRAPVRPADVASTPARSSWKSR